MLRTLVFVEKPVTTASKAQEAQLRRARDELAALIAGKTIDAIQDPAAPPAGPVESEPAPGPAGNDAPEDTP